MQPHLFLLLAQRWCDKEGLGWESGEGIKEMLEPALLLGEGGLGKQCFQIQLETGQKQWYVLPRRASLFEEMIS